MTQKVIMFVSLVDRLIEDLVSLTQKLVLALVQNSFHFVGKILSSIKDSKLSFITPPCLEIYGLKPSKFKVKILLLFTNTSVEIAQQNYKTNQDCNK